MKRYHTCFERQGFNCIICKPLTAYDWCDLISRKRREMFGRTDGTRWKLIRTLTEQRETKECRLFLFLNQTFIVAASESNLLANLLIFWFDKSFQTENQLQYGKIFERLIFCDWHHQRSRSITDQFNGNSVIFVFTGFLSLGRGDIQIAQNLLEFYI